MPRSVGLPKVAAVTEPLRVAHVCSTAGATGVEAHLLTLLPSFAAERVVPVLFGRNPDQKQTKNRWHFDLAPSDQAAEVARLEELGAKRADIGQTDVSWVVMVDIEGNEFCVLESLPAEAPTSA